MADDAAAVPAAAAEAISNKNENKQKNKKNNNKNKQGGGNGFIIGLAGNVLRSGVGLCKWAGDTIGEPVEQGGGGQQEDGAPSQQAEVETPPSSSSSSSSGEEPRSASDTAVIDKVVDGAPSADDGLAVAPNQLGAGAGLVDGAGPAAKVGGEEDGRAPAGPIGSTRGRAAAALIHALESRCFWGVILVLVLAGVALGVVACRFFPVLAGLSAGGNRCGGGLCMTLCLLCLWFMDQSQSSGVAERVWVRFCLVYVYLVVHRAGTSGKSEWSAGCACSWVLRRVLFFLPIGIQPCTAVVVVVL